MSNFRDKVVVVTGASRGIGAGAAQAFAKASALVVANHPSDGADEHRRAVETWRGEGGFESDRIVPLAANVNVCEEVEAMFQTIRDRFDHVDILVNNAGISRDHTVIKMTNDEWRDVLAVNLDGAFYNSRAAIPLLSDGGRIVTISSMVAYTGNVGVANYAASKAGLLGLTKTLALELAKRKITVNAVCPGFINTAIIQTMPENVISQITERIPLGRRGEVNDIVECILFLASDAASYITGQSIGVNGGLYMGH